jgi:hypothetical protein
MLTALLFCRGLEISIHMEYTCNIFRTNHYYWSRIQFYRKRISMSVFRKLYASTAIHNQSSYISQMGFSVLLSSAMAV